MKGGTCPAQVPLGAAGTARDAPPTARYSRESDVTYG